MSVKVMGWVWDSQLPPMEKLVALAYADHADHEGNNIYPSLNTIAKKTGLARRSVVRVRERLIADGILRANARPNFAPARLSMSQRALEMYLRPLKDSDPASPPIGTGGHSPSDSVSSPLVTHSPETSDPVSSKPLEPSITTVSTTVSADDEKHPPKKVRVKAPAKSPTNFVEHPDQRVQLYLDIVHPEITPTNAGMITTRVAVDRLAEWQATLDKWVIGTGGKSYRWSNFGGMFDDYDARVKSSDAQARQASQPRQSTNVEPAGFAALRRFTHANA